MECLTFRIKLLNELVKILKQKLISLVNLNHCTVNLHLNKKNSEHDTVLGDMIELICENQPSMALFPAEQGVTNLPMVSEDDPYFYIFLCLWWIKNIYILYPVIQHSFEIWSVWIHCKLLCIQIYTFDFKLHNIV